jgi:hypothetical protein
MTAMARKQRNSNPIEHRALLKRSKVAAEGEVQPASIPLLDLSLKGVTATRVSQEAGRIRVVADVDANGLTRGRRGEHIPVIRLREKDIDRKLANAELKGFRPAGMPTTFKPKAARRTHQLRPPKGEDLDLGGTIFGSDDRYLFDDLAFPWRTTGKVRTVGKWGSGTTIGPRLVLTASHVVNWTGGDDGGVAWLTFTPGYFDGSGPWGEVAATHVISGCRRQVRCPISRRRSTTASW